MSAPALSPSARRRVASLWRALLAASEDVDRLPADLRRLAGGSGCLSAR